MSKEVFQTKSDRKASAGLRITVTMESTSEAGMKWALANGFQLARDRYMRITVSHKDDPTTRVSCRTTRLRKKKANDNPTT